MIDDAVDLAIKIGVLIVWASLVVIIVSGAVVAVREAFSQ